MKDVAGRNMQHFWQNLLLCAAILLSLGKIGSCDNCAEKVPPEFVYEFAHNDDYPERVLAYYREDLALAQIITNYHAYDVIWLTTPEYAVDRNGELFYFFHQQMVARYESERISVGLPELVPFDDYMMPMAEAYFPNYPPASTKYQYYGRPANMTLHDTLRFSIDDVTKWTARIVEAIKCGYVIHQNGTKIKISGQDGMNVIGRLIQSVLHSPNHAYYGCLHSALHNLFGRITDPLEQAHHNYDIGFIFPLGMMDPIFYRWHKYLVSVLELYKEVRMNPYTRKELSWEAVKLHEVSVIGDKTKKTNELTTFTQQWKPTLNHGFDFFLDHSITVLFHILNHEEFNYNLVVENLSGKKVTATVRLMLAPVTFINGEQILLQKQRKLFIELDRFKAVLSSKSGKQTITHHSAKSWVTIPLERSTENLATTVMNIGMHLVPRCIWPDRIFDEATNRPEENIVLPEKNLAPLTQNFTRRHCGWPHHLLIPRGNETGVSFVLFAMLTNWEEDKAQSSPEQEFGDATAYCGGNFQKYPDKKPMGFPFDRPLPKEAYLEDFLSSSMATTSIKIIHSDKIVNLGETFNP